MKNITVIIIVFLLAFVFEGLAQNPPWERPLKIAWSNDGTNFNSPVIFQDSSGVPSVTRWKGDTLICAFQWFRKPENSSSWDKVAVKFSYDNGQNWTAPIPIIVNGIPANFQRPFDPTITVFGKDSIRIYFSSSNGMPQMGSDSIINTYSAKSHDGINYYFEPNPRVDQKSNRVIDPAVIFFKNIWHYEAPVGSPQQGAFHYVSPDGLDFIQAPNIPSDNFHNWTGNYLINSTDELRFYGSGSNNIWYNSSPDGGTWNGYINTNIQGGDPGVFKISDHNYLMIYVGEPYSTNQISEFLTGQNQYIYPSVAKNQIIFSPATTGQKNKFRIFSVEGKCVLSGEADAGVINIEQLNYGAYFLQIDGENKFTLKFIKN